MHGGVNNFIRSPCYLKGGAQRDHSIVMQAYASQTQRHPFTEKIHILEAAQKERKPYNNEQTSTTIGHLNTVAMIPIYLLTNCISIGPFCNRRALNRPML